MNANTPGSPESDSIDTLQVCKNCSNEFVGKFCNRCGEKVIDQHERSIVHFLEGVFHMITHVDGKIFRNLKMILLKPGSLSKNFMIGRRQPFMKPIQMFFVANLIYFLFPVLETFNTSLYSQTNLQSYSTFAKTMVVKKMETEKITEEVMGQKYNAKTATTSKLLLVLFIPMFAVVFGVLNFKRSRYFADHILMATEFMCYTIFYNTIFFGFLIYAIVMIGQSLETDLQFIFRDEHYVLLPVVALSTLYFLTFAERTFYEQKWLWAIGKAFLILVSLSFLLDIYRFILFYVTIKLI